MARKKKPKVDPKVFQTQYRNKYLRKMKVIYENVHPDFFHLLSRLRVDTFYLMRCTVIQVQSKAPFSKKFFRAFPPIPSPWMESIRLLDRPLFHLPPLDEGDEAEYGADPSFIHERWFPSLSAVLL